MKLKNTLPFAVFAGLALVSGSTHGALLVYEGFDYTPAFSDPTAGGAGQSSTSDQSLTSKGGTSETGLSGTWENDVADAHDMYLVEGSLAFGDLQTSGNRVRYNSNLNSDIFNRGLSTSVAGGGETWFSFLGNKLNSTGHGAEREGIAIGNGAVSTAQIGANDPAGYHGFGVGWESAAVGWTAYGWDGTNQVTGAAGLTVARDGSETVLLVGQIQYGAGTGGSDIFSLYNYELNNGSVDGGNNALITSIEVDVDESLLNTLNVTRQVNTAYDEIRIGESLEDVVVQVPEPTTALLGGLGTLLLLLRRRR